MKKRPEAAGTPTPVRMPEIHPELKAALRVLFPSITDEDLGRAALNISDYLDDVSVFYDALVSDRERYERFTELTTAEARARVKDGPVVPVSKETNPSRIDA